MTSKFTANANTSDAELIQFAKLSEMTERYEEMARAMAQLVRNKANQLQQSADILSTEERNLLSVAYKNLIGTKRSAWRIISSISASNSSESTVQSKICEDVEAEMKKLADEILTLLDENIIKSLSTKSIEDATQAEHFVFFYKMIGDYRRYLAEIESKDGRAGQMKLSLQAYNEAKRISDAHLQTMNPIRLGLALNFSVFHYEMEEDSTAACEMAKKAFDDGIEQLDQLAEDQYKDATMIMQLLRDNLTLWNTGNQTEEEDK